MRLFEHLREALTNVFFAKLRSMLAVLGVLVGTASVVAMVMGGQLATQEALKQFKSLGTDLLAVSINNSYESDQPNVGKGAELTLRDAMSLVSADHTIQAVAPYTQIFQPIIYFGKMIPSSILGVTSPFADIVKIKLAQGRFISTLDGFGYYCVVGQQVYKHLQQAMMRNPLGETIQIGKQVFLIIGVAEEWPENNFLYANINSSIMIPLLASTAISKYAAINNVLFRLHSDAPITQVEGHIKQQLGKYVTNKNITMRSARELIAKMKNQSNILTVFLGLVGSVSLFVGGIGVMNIMLVSVIERKREIGIRLAVGARRLDIILLFIAEAIFLSCIGGVLGVVIGILIAYLIALFWAWDFTFFLLPPLVGFSVSVLVGIFFGFYPAYIAAKLNPIEALRAE